MKPIISFFIIIFLCVTISGCAKKEVQVYDEKSLVYLPTEDSSFDGKSCQPAFIVDGGDEYNRIGTPSAIQEGADSSVSVFVDETSPSLYFMEKEFTTSKGSYKNLIYRIHFKGIPFSMFPFHLSYGKNTGIMVVVTTDLSGNPLLVTTVHTCGCYMAIVPTTNLDPSCLPDNWTGKLLDVYGETFPAILDFKSLENPRLVVNVRKDNHRISWLALKDNLNFISENTGYIPMPVLDMVELEYLDTGFATTSFFYEKGWKKGFVKDSEKIWETLFMGIIACDFYVGTDKIYGDRSKTGTRFYTSLKFWNRKESDMWNFERFLEFWGWQL